MEEPLLLPNDEYNRALRRQVAPPDWVNPEPADRYTLVVLGGGTAGLVTAAGAAALGARVALVERLLLGGDCLNYGCVPSKALLAAARAAHASRQGARADDGSTARSGNDVTAAMARLRRLRAEIAGHDSVDRFRGLGVDVFLGEGHFTAPGTIRVAGKSLRFGRAAVCTGARAALPPIPGLAEAGCLTNETVFDLTEQPSRLAVIGGGPIGCELAQAFARFGSRVTLLEAAGRLLPREDSEAAEVVQRALTRDGVEVLTNCRILSASRHEREKSLAIERAGQQWELAADSILVSAGRLPNVEGIGLETAGIAFDVRMGVTVDERLRTTNRLVYAAGDVCSAFKFTHAADAQARLLLANALFSGRGKHTSLVIPWCTYTDPEVAQVGLTAATAAQQGIPLTTFTVPLAEVDRAILDSETEGFARIHLRQGSDRIVGATLVARHAGESIGVVTLAMANGLGIGALGRTILPYPTQAEALRKLADAWNRTRLTPFTGKVLATWLRWLR